MGFKKGNKLGKKFESGSKHWNWKGGFKYYPSGSKKVAYKRIKIDGIYVAEHRYVLEKHLGRKLERSEIVHHIDHDGLNNSIDNLQIMTQTEHTRLHRKKKGSDDL